MALHLNSMSKHMQNLFYNAALCQRQYSMGPLAMRTDLIESEEYK